MPRILYNELRIEMSLTPVTPTLIASGENGQFVRYLHPRENVTTAYLPGSSLKGALRHAAEQVTAAVKVDCCDPLNAPCSAREVVRKAADGAAVYRALCSVCRMFGSRVFSSPLTVTDAYPADPLNELAIHELPNGASEAVLGDPFYGTLTLHNFERWQIGLLGQLFEQINLGSVALGANRSAGMGRILICPLSAEIQYRGLFDDPARDRLATHLHGAGQFAGTGNPYGFRWPDVGEMPDLPPNCEFNAGFGYVEVLIGQPVEPLFEQQSAAWQVYATAAAQRGHFPTPPTMPPSSSGVPPRLPPQ